MNELPVPCLKCGGTGYIAWKAVPAIINGRPAPGYQMALIDPYHPKAHTFPARELTIEPCECPWGKKWAEGLT